MITPGQEKPTNSGIQENLEWFRSNPYPGSGFVIGRLSSRQSNQGLPVIGYWIMRQPGGPNLRIEVADKFVRSKTAGDPEVELTKTSDHTIMRPGVLLPSTMVHVVSNGSQTDTVYQELTSGGGDDNSGNRLNQRFAETVLRLSPYDDQPHHTPRIAGAVALKKSLDSTYHYSTTRRNVRTGATEHVIGSGRLNNLPPGLGVCMHEYQGDETVLPTFSGSAYILPLEGGSAREAAELFWNNLNRAHRIAVVFRELRGEVPPTHAINRN